MRTDPYTGPWWEYVRNIDWSFDGISRSFSPGRGHWSPAERGAEIWHCWTPDRDARGHPSRSSQRVSSSKAHDSVSESLVSQNEPRRRCPSLVSNRLVKITVCLSEAKPSRRCPFLCVHSVLAAGDPIRSVERQQRAVGIGRRKRSRWHSLLIWIIASTFANRSPAAKCRSTE